MQKSSDDVVYKFCGESTNPTRTKFIPQDHYLHNIKNPLKSDELLLVIGTIKKNSKYLRMSHLDQGHSVNESGSIPFEISQ